jgi:hypothetical protein
VRARPAARRPPNSGIKPPTRDADAFVKNEEATRRQHVVIRTVGTRVRAEGTEDLAAWLADLPDCPEVTSTAVASCTHASHRDEAPTWFYVEADAAAGVARIRCLPGGHAKDVIDSAEHWTFPGVWSCESCQQSIAEVVFGVHDEEGTATWLVLAVRCVECGDIAGLTDIVLRPVPLDDLLASLAS